MTTAECCANLATTRYGFLETEMLRSNVMSASHPILDIIMDRSIFSNYIEDVRMTSDGGNPSCYIVTKTMLPTQPTPVELCGQICNAPIRELTFRNVQCLFAKQKMEYLQDPICRSFSPCTHPKFLVELNDILNAYLRGLISRISGYILRDFYKPLSDLGCDCENSGTTKTLLDWMKTKVIDLVKTGKNSSTPTTDNVPKLNEWNQNTMLSISAEFTEMVLNMGGILQDQDTLFIGVPAELYAKLNMDAIPNQQGVQQYGAGTLWSTQLRSGIRLLRLPNEAFYINEQNRIVLPIFFKGAYTFISQIPPFRDGQLQVGTQLSTPTNLIGEFFSTLMLASFGDINTGGYATKMVFSTLIGGVKTDPFRLGLVLGYEVDPAKYPQAQRITTNGDISRIIVLQNPSMCISVCPPVTVTG